MGPCVELKYIQTFTHKSKLNSKMIVKITYYYRGQVMNIKQVVSSAVNADKRII